jgi:ribosomal subunit interface protein
MNVGEIKILCDDFEVTEAISERVHHKFGHLLDHYAKYISRIEVLLKSDNNKEKTVEANVHVHKRNVNGKDLHSKAKGEDVYSLIDEVVSQLKKPLEKYKEEHLGHQK